jgi:hypothetical protein
LKATLNHVSQLTMSQALRELRLSHGQGARLLCTLLETVAGLGGGGIDSGGRNHIDKELDICGASNIRTGGLHSLALLHWDCSEAGSRNVWAALAGLPEPEQDPLPDGSGVSSGAGSMSHWHCERGGCSRADAALLQHAFSGLSASLRRLEITGCSSDVVHALCGSVQFDHPHSCGGLPDGLQELRLTQLTPEALASHLDGTGMECLSQLVGSLRVLTRLELGAVGAASSSGSCLAACTSAWPLHAVRPGLCVRWDAHEEAAYSCLHA